MQRIIRDGISLNWVMRFSCAIGLCLLLSFGEARCEGASGEGALPLEPLSLECVEVTRSRVIRRICYDEFRLIVDFEGSLREFCQVERETAEAFLQA